MLLNGPEILIKAITHFTIKELYSICSIENTNLVKLKPAFCEMRERKLTFHTSITFMFLIPHVASETMYQKPIANYLMNDIQITCIGGPFSFFF